MDYCSLGANHLKVSKLCLGTMTFGSQTDRNEAERIVSSAKDHGVNFIDTADVYVQGESERIVGELIKPSRDWWVLATKAGQTLTDSPNHGGLSRKCLTKSLDESFRRLRDYGKKSQWESVHTVLSSNFRMSNITASVGLSHISELESFLPESAEGTKIGSIFAT